MGCGKAHHRAAPAPAQAPAAAGGGSTWTYTSVLACLGWKESGTTGVVEFGWELLGGVGKWCLSCYKTNARRSTTAAGGKGLHRASGEKEGCEMTLCGWVGRGWWWGLERRPLVDRAHDPWKTALLKPKPSQLPHSGCCGTLQCVTVSATQRASEPV